jgi:Flp pilus assembly pilin Flp
LVKRPRRGATAVEYSLLLAFIAGVIVLTVTSLGATLLSGLDSFLTSF